MTAISDELDARHDRARAAFERKDLAAYRDVFSARLAYRGADGRVIDRDRLMRDVADQLRDVRRVQSSYVREQIEVEGDRATEIVVQTASAWITAFLVIHRGWVVIRKGRYAWRKEGDGLWRIEDVAVIDQAVSGRWHVGLRPPTDA